MIYEALVKNDGTIFRLVYLADDYATAWNKAKDRLVNGDVLVNVAQIQQKAA